MVFRRMAFVIPLVAVVGSAPLASAQTWPEGEEAPEPPPKTSKAPGSPREIPPPRPPAYRPRRDVYRPKVIKDWLPGEPIPEGYEAVKRIRKGLVIGGAAGFGGIYLSNVFVATLAEDVGGNVEALYVPIVGPFLLLGDSELTTLDLLLVLDGLGQAATLAMLIAGLSARRDVLVLRERDEYGRLQLVPFATAEASGLALVGSF